MKKQQRPRRSARQWQAVISKHEVSGESVAMYCRKQDLCEKTFYSWRKRLRKKESISKNKFIELKAPQTTAITQSIIRVISPQGYAIEIPEGINALSIKNVLTAVGCEC